MERPHLEADRTDLKEEWFKYADQALEAARSGDLQKIISFAQNGLDVTRIQEKYSKNTLFHIAAKHGHLEIIQFLDRFNANIRAENISGEIPIHLASRFGRFEVVEFLLEKDPSMVDMETKYGEIPLHSAAAARSPKPEVMNLLIQYDSNIYATDNQGRTPSQRIPREHRFIIMVDGFFMNLREQNKKPGCYT